MSLECYQQVPKKLLQLSLKPLHCYLENSQHEPEHILQKGSYNAYLHRALDQLQFLAGSMYWIFHSLGGGGEFSHTTENIVAWPIILGVVVLNGSAVTKALMRSFTVRIFLSISGTCSPGAQIFRRKPLSSSKSRRISNSLSAKHISTLKPLLL
jgi:hypothetical protein